MALLEIDSVRFSYGQQQILSDIYLSVSQGEVVGFLGRNGCGKSTFLKVIFGALQGENQSVRIDGNYAPRSFTTGKVKFLTHDMMLPAYLTPVQAIRLFDCDEAALYAHSELKDCWNMRLRTLSSGMRKYVETLIFLHAPCDFLLLDEPFSFVAPIHVEKLIPEIKLASAKKGILLTDHQYRSILEVSDRLYMMRDRALFTIENEANLREFGYLN